MRSLLVRRRAFYIDAATEFKTLVAALTDPDEARRTKARRELEALGRGGSIWFDRETGERNEELPGLFAEAIRKLNSSVVSAEEKNEIVIFLQRLAS
jgi:hypothetical protein